MDEWHTNAVFIFSIIYIFLATQPASETTRKHSFEMVGDEDEDGINTFLGEKQETKNHGVTKPKQSESDR